MTHEHKQSSETRSRRDWESVASNDRAMMGKTVKALIGVIEEAAIHIWQRTADRRIMCARLVANVVDTARTLPARRRHAAIDRDRAQSSPAEALVVRGIDEAPQGSLRKACYVELLQVIIDASHHRRDAAIDVVVAEVHVRTPPHAGTPPQTSRTSTYCAPG